MVEIHSDKDKKIKSRSKKSKISPKTDYFLSQGIDYVDYKDVATLRKFINRQGRINHRKTSRLTAKTQRQVARAIKRARQMVLLPYTIVEQDEEVQKK
jgi:small subunit ribosomal protein S18